MVHHFEMGIWLLFLAYAVSVAGSTIGLACAYHARTATGGTRMGWLALSAVSIGGVGIWLMHFIGMLGFATPGQPVRYDITRTALSAVLAIGAVFGGLLVFGVQKRSALWRLLVAGTITGLAVNLMHYTGMWAVNIKGTITYNPFLVVLSVIIAVGAATAALWFTVSADGMAQRLMAGLVMGIASTGMHYVGMAAVNVDLDPDAADPVGVEVFSFLFPVFILSAFALAVPIVAVLTIPKREDAEPAPPGEHHALDAALVQ
jgi:NO-binding membrane sensor protein with MHYT domain